MKLSIPVPQLNICCNVTLALSTQIGSTNVCSGAIIDCNQPLPDSNLTNSNQVDTDINNDGDTQYSEKPKKYNHITPKIFDTTITTTPVHPTLIM